MAGSRMMYSPDKMMGSKGLHGAPITAPGCFPSGRYSPPPYRAAPDPMPPPPRRCMPNPTVSKFHFTLVPSSFISPRYVLTLAFFELEEEGEGRGEGIDVPNKRSL